MKQAPHRSNSNIGPPMPLADNDVEPMVVGGYLASSDIQSGSVTPMPSLPPLTANAVELARASVRSLIGVIACALAFNASMTIPHGALPNRANTRLPHAGNRYRRTDSRRVQPLHTPSRLNGGLPLRCYHRSIVGLNRDAPLPPRSRTVVAVAVVAMALTVWVLAMLSHFGSLRPGSVAPHSSPPSLTSLSDGFTASVDAPQLVDDSLTACHYAFSNAVLPKSSSTTLTALGVVVAVVAVAGWLAPRVVAAGRGPPCGPAAFLTGQDLLTRFCVARR